MSPNRCLQETVTFMVAGSILGASIVALDKAHTMWTGMILTVTIEYLPIALLQVLLDESEV